MPEIGVQLLTERRAPRPASAIFVPRFHRIGPTGAPRGNEARRVPRCRQKECRGNQKNRIDPVDPLQDRSDRHQQGGIDSVPFEQPRRLGHDIAMNRPGAVIEPSL